MANETESVFYIEKGDTLPLSSIKLTALSNDRYLYF